MARAPILSRVLRNFCVLFVGASIYCMAQPPAWAEDEPEEPTTELVDQQELLERAFANPDHQVFIVSRGGVNIRSIPNPNGDKRDTLPQGTLVHGIVAEEASDWFKVYVDEKELGFAYGQALSPILNGQLPNPIEGNVTGTNVTCSYKLKFEGRSLELEAGLIASDYELSLTCKGPKKSKSFKTPFFITETPFDGGNLEIYQINIDFPDVSKGPDDQLSLISLYDVKAQKVKYDEPTLAELSVKPANGERDATSLEEAIKAAIDLSLTSLTNQGWKQILDGPSRN